MKVVCSFFRFGLNLLSTSTNFAFLNTFYNTYYSKLAAFFEKSVFYLLTITGKEGMITDADFSGWCWSCEMDSQI